MPNYCNYLMFVKGRKENVEEFIKIIQADYNYSTMKFSYSRHLFRVFEASCEELELVDKDVYMATISGQCAWSVYSCMFSGKGTYYSKLKEDYTVSFKGTTLPLESKNLNLEIEAYSEESGMCFQEHYIIKNGCVNTKECVDYYEYYIGDYKTKKEAEADCGTKFSKEEWKARNEEEYVRRGGFSSWDCNI